MWFNEKTEWTVPCNADLVGWCYLLRSNLTKERLPTASIRIIRHFNTLIFDILNTATCIHWNKDGVNLWQFQFKPSRHVTTLHSYITFVRAHNWILSSYPLQQCNLEVAVSFWPWQTFCLWVSENIFLITTQLHSCKVTVVSDAIIILEIMSAATKIADKQVWSPNE